ncbi:DUF1697 domain-containing protein [uncultured Gilvimarinus sp.]|uniref:DUF1697 domain-containing protein n=1 Tax=uncultured Gilvimarinus sp. TaxID=1689143 RepID=UPI0030EE35AE|tara:strand:+ start:2651 stop:3169 length:519 start_codon:yes stop_codon:yes gene_type:complete
MTLYIAFFRGLNVGGKNIIPMKGLAALMESCGYQNVKTYIQSGNVVFYGVTAPGLEIVTAVEREYGFKPDVLFLQESELLDAIEHGPFNSEEGKTSHFYFCKTKPKLDQAKLKKYAAESERYDLVGNVFYLHAPSGIGRSKLVANIESCLGAVATGRNLNTINKVLEMMRNA